MWSRFQCTRPSSNSCWKGHWSSVGGAVKCGTLTQEQKLMYCGVAHQFIWTRACSVLGKDTTILQCCGHIWGHICGNVHSYRCNVVVSGVSTCAYVRGLIISSRCGQSKDLVVANCSIEVCRLSGKACFNVKTQILSSYTKFCPTFLDSDIYNYTVLQCHESGNTSQSLGHCHTQEVMSRCTEAKSPTQNDPIRDDYSNDCAYSSQKCWHALCSTIAHTIEPLHLEITDIARVYTRVTQCRL